MATESDGVDETLGAMGRVAATAAGTVIEGVARRREAEARTAAARDRDGAAADRARAKATEEVTAIAVLRGDGQRAGVEDLHRAAVARGDAAPSPRDGGPLEPLPRREPAAVQGDGGASFWVPEVAEARDVAARSQALPAAEAVSGPAAAPKARAPRARGRGRGAERTLDR